MTFTCYNDPAANGIIYLCEEMPEIFGCHEGLAHHWQDYSMLCKHIARTECGLRGPLSAHTSSVDSDGVEVFTVRVKEIER